MDIVNLTFTSPLFRYSWYYCAVAIQKVEERCHIAQRGQGRVSLDALLLGRLRWAGAQYLCAQLQAHLL